jgi:branched-chain amino acid transport system substrate-binding protein
MHRFFFKKAIPSLLVGMAFFFWGCQPRVLLQEKESSSPEEEQTTHPSFLSGEAFLREGRIREALPLYEAFVKEHPTDRGRVVALHRMADIHLTQGDYERARGIYAEIGEDYPDYSGLGDVKFGLAQALYRLGEYDASKKEAIAWILSFPDHPLRADVQILLGMSYSALGMDLQAFLCWLETKRMFGGDEGVQRELNGRLERSITGGGLEFLEQILPHVGDTGYAPEVYYRIALLYLEREDLPEAQKAAMGLIRSSPEEAWVNRGRDLLERIGQEQSVRRTVLGCLLPLSGPFAIYGREVLNGMQLGLEAGSDTGSMDRLDLVVRDTGSDPEETLTALEDLVYHEKVMAMIGPLSSKASGVAAKRAQELGVPIITLTQKEGITDEGDHVFRHLLTPSMEVKTLLEWTVGNLGLERFAVLYPDNPYGRFFMNLFQAALSDLGGRITAMEPYSPEETDFAVPIRKLIGTHAPKRPGSEDQRESGKRPVVDLRFDAVFVPDNFQRIAMIAPQLAYHDITHVQLLGTSLWQSQQLIETTKDYVQGAVFPTGFFAGSSNSAVREFVKEYRERFNSEPDLLAAIGHDTIRLLKEVLSDEDIRTRRDLQRALFRVHDFPGLTGEISIDPSGEVVKEPLLLTVSGREFTLLTE